MKLMKASSKTLWLRNLELAMASLVLGFPVQAATQSDLIRRKGYFHGFDWVILVLVALHAFGGLLVALVVKHANNMLKVRWHVLTRKNCSNYVVYQR